MDITEVRVKLVSDAESRLQAFCSVTFDKEFVVRDLKVIDGPNGPFVAMPSRRLTAKCVSCGFRNEIRSRFCCSCGKRQSAPSADDSQSRLFADIAHPINSAARTKIHQQVMEAVAEERMKAEEPGYVCAYDEIDTGALDSDSVNSDSVTSGS